MDENARLKWRDPSWEWLYLLFPMVTRLAVEKTGLLNRQIRSTRLKSKTIVPKKLAATTVFLAYALLPFCRLTSFQDLSGLSWQIDAWINGQVALRLRTAAVLKWLFMVKPYLYKYRSWREKQRSPLSKRPCKGVLVANHEPATQADECLNPMWTAYLKFGHFFQPHGT